MKFLLPIFLLLTIESFAQTGNTIKIPAPSPKETIQADLGFTQITINYYRILRRNREIFGEGTTVMFPYEKICRTGANEGTRVTFNDDVIVKGKKVKKGTYVILSWPGRFSWDVALYSDLTIRGVPEKYDLSKEALRVTVTPTILNSTVETFTVTAKPINKNTAALQIAFEKVLIEVPFSANASDSESNVTTLNATQSFGLTEIAYKYTDAANNSNTNKEFSGGTITLKQESDFGGELLKPGLYELLPDIKNNRIRIKGNGSDLYITPQKTPFEAALSNAANGYALSFYRIANDQKMLWLKLDVTNQSFLIPIKCDYDEIVMRSISEAEATGTLDNSLFSSAMYYYDNDKDLNQALIWIEKAVVKKQDAYWMILLKAKIEYKLGWLDKALKTAQSGLAEANKALNADYARMHEALISQISADITARTKADKTAPVIVVTGPADNRGLKVGEDKKTLLVTGKATDESGISSVSINGSAATVDAEGNFRATISLATGNNNILISATDTKMNTGEFQFTVVRNAAAVAAEKIIPVATLSDEGKYYALIIGVQNYIDPAIPDLENPVGDATALSSVLQSQYTFEKQNIKLLKNPTRQQVFDAFELLAVKIKAEDNLVIFYAGHGNWDEVRKQGYWYPSDAFVNNRASWLSNADLKEYISLMPSKHTLLITDACFAGSIFKTRSLGPTASVAIKQLYELPSRKAMTSGALKEVPDKSVFIEYLVKRLKQNPEKYLSAEQLFSSFKIAVINNSANGQVPQFGEIKEAGDEGGDFIFIKR